MSSSDESEGTFIKDALIKAIERKQSDFALEIIKIGFKPKTLHLGTAIIYEQIELAFKLLELGVKPDSYTLHLAISKKIKELSLKFIQLGVEPDSSCLSQAILSKEVEIAFKIIERGVKPDSGTLVEAIENKLDKFALEITKLELAKIKDYHFLPIIKYGLSLNNKEFLMLFLEQQKLSPLIFGAFLISCFLKTHSFMTNACAFGDEYYETLTDQFASPVKINKIENIYHFSPSSVMSRNETQLFIFGNDHNNAFRYDRELPLKLFQNGYEILLISLHEQEQINYSLITNLLKSITSKISGIFIFAHGNSQNKSHFIHKETTEFIHELREALPSDKLSPNGVDITIR